jgi:hypothetical protein
LGLTGEVDGVETEDVVGAVVGTIAGVGFAIGGGVAGDGDMGGDGGRLVGARGGVTDGDEGGVVEEAASGETGAGWWEQVVGWPPTWWEQGGVAEAYDGGSGVADGEDWPGVTCRSCA